MHLQIILCVLGVQWISSAWTPMGVCWSCAQILLAKIRQQAGSYRSSKEKTTVCLSEVAGFWKHDGLLYKQKSFSTSQVNPTRQPLKKFLYCVSESIKLAVHVLVIKKCSIFMLRTKCLRWNEGTFQKNEKKKKTINALFKNTITILLFHNVRTHYKYKNTFHYWGHTSTYITM